MLLTPGQELVFIGIDVNRAALTAELNACLCTDAELVPGVDGSCSGLLAAGIKAEDPLNEWPAAQVSSWLLPLCRELQENPPLGGQCISVSMS